MALLLLFAFLAGVFTVLSPCILPVLPAILAISTTQGRFRPLGAVVGLVLSFTFFTLALTALVHTVGLSANLLRYAAIAIVFLFGLVMLLPRWSEFFTQKAAPLADIGLRVQQSSSGSGFGGGFVLGIALGLLWTPCAGPILAAVTTLVATQEIGFATISMTLAYSIGCGVPLFLIAYGGSKVIQSSRFLSQHSQGLRQVFGGLMILTALAIALHWDMFLQQQITRFVPPVLVEDNPLVKQELQKWTGNGEQRWAIGIMPPDQLSDFGPAPELTGIVNWINSPPLSISQLQGKVVLIDFWTYSCINCLRTLPYIEQWYADYKDKGLVVIGVHTPEFEFEKDPRNVADAASRLGVVYPIAQDNDYKTWQAFSNHYWPAHYLIDQQGHVRMVHFGEGGYVDTENAIRKLLGMEPKIMAEPRPITRPISPETYVGTKRAERYTSGISLKTGAVATYTYKGPLKDDEAGLRGPWKVEDERITAEGDDSYLDYNFLATKVYLVLAGSSSTPIQVMLDGKPAGEVAVDGDRKYDMVSTAYGRHVLSLKIPKGVSAYAFTFGDE